jgi:lipid-binding SYLF domain-containing protein
MKSLSLLLTFACVALLALPGTALRAGGRDAAMLEDASEVLDVLATMCIPPALLRDAQGIVVLPSILKAGLVFGGRYGRGVLLARGPDGCWGRPEFVSLTGGSFGWQVGIQSTDLALVFKTRSGLDRMRTGKLTLGVDAAIAAGPIGREATAGTDVLLTAEIFSYSRSRGLFLGASLEGAALLLDRSVTEAYYRHEVAAVLDARTGRMVPVTPPSGMLQLKLTQLTVAPALAPPPLVQEPPLPPPPPPAPSPAPPQ